MGKYAEKWGKMPIFALKYPILSLSLCKKLKNALNLHFFTKKFARIKKFL